MSKIPSEDRQKNNIYINQCTGSLPAFYFLRIEVNVRASQRACGFSFSRKISKFCRKCRLNEQAHFWHKTFFRQKKLLWKDEGGKSFCLFPTLCGEIHQICFFLPLIRQKTGTCDKDKLCFRKFSIHLFSSFFLGRFSSQNKKFF